MSLALAILMATQENTLSAEEQKAGWKLLFDGKTSAGWRGYKKDKCPDGWKVEGGALARVGGGGDIVTVEAYDNFELALEWKVAEGGNSGIMYRVAETEGASYMTGPEYQLLDNKKHGDGKSTLTSAGSCYALYAPTKDVTKPAGQWNQARILVQVNHVEHWLNGERIVTYELGSDDWNKRVAASKFKDWPQFGKVARGHILLQDHGDRVEFRNIKIRPMGSK
jgi:hypothetical protein